MVSGCAEMLGVVWWHYYVCMVFPPKLKRRLSRIHLAPHISLFFALGEENDVDRGLIELGSRIFQHNTSHQFMRGKRRWTCEDTVWWCFLIMSPSAFTIIESVALSWQGMIWLCFSERWRWTLRLIGRGPPLTSRSALWHGMQSCTPKRSGGEY